VDFVHVIEEDPHNPDLLFVGTDVGAYASTDRGQSWQRFMEGMPAVPVHDLEIHPRDRELIAATHGRSIWIVGIAALEGFTDDVIADGGALFEPAPAFQFGQPARGGESYGQMWWARPTPGAGARINYYIGEELAAAVAEAAEAESEDEDRPADPPQGRAGGRRGSGGPGGMGARGPQVEISITGPDGEAFGTVAGPATAGLHSVDWDMRGESPATAEPGPYDKKQQEVIAARLEAVRDSLVEEGWDEQFLDRMAGAFTGQTSRNQLFSMFGGGPGGGGAGQDPEAFRARPGEQMGGGGGRGGSYGRMRELANIVMPGAGLGQIFRRVGGGRGGNQAPLADPGVYTLTMTVGDRTFTQSITVERVGELTGNNSPFEEEWERFLMRMNRGR
jgi:hypothetical protein